MFSIHRVSSAVSADSQHRLTRRAVIPKHGVRQKSGLFIISAVPAGTKSFSVCTHACYVIPEFLEL